MRLVGGVGGVISTVKVAAIVELAVIVATQGFVVPEQRPVGVDDQALNAYPAAGVARIDTCVPEPIVAGQTEPLHVAVTVPEPAATEAPKVTGAYFKK